ncbi:hypothetical protein BKA70DRAFT_48221 [Coprinopsis sp. MPI-PUGE-AT-0042]|nr:hypothetical protein BKA70DRAFT_48221 [Coprinopsis sp. MPI-PUGE-AT-0042]
MITKVIPDRVYTTTDSTGGIAVRTEYVEVGGSKSSGPSTGLLVGVIVAVLGLLVCVAAVGLLLWRRKKRRRHAEMSVMSVTGSFGEHFVQNRGVAMGQVNPFTLHGQEQSPSPSTSNPFSLIIVEMCRRHTSQPRPILHQRRPLLHTDYPRAPRVFQSAKSKRTSYVCSSAPDQSFPLVSRLLLLCIT